MDPPKIYTDCHPLENIHHFSADSSDDDSVKTPTLVFRILSLWSSWCLVWRSHWPSHTKIRQIQNKRYFYLDRVWSLEIWSSSLLLDVLFLYISRNSPSKSKISAPQWSVWPRLCWAGRANTEYANCFDFN